MMGLLSMFGASPETVDRVQKGLLDFGNAFPEIRRQRMELEAAQADLEWKKKERAAALQKQKEEEDLKRRRMGYLDAVSPTMGPAMPVDPAKAIASGITTQELGALMPKAPEMMNIPAGGAVFDPVTKKPLYQAPFKPEAPKQSDLTQLLTEMQALPPGHPLRRYYEAQVKKMTTHAPGTSVSVNTGQRGLDNTLKLRGDFRSEPIYKAHQEMKSAYAQIQQSLKQASPAGDLAGATKIMKLLDPGSVVRESELGMAMAASGLLDRVENYAKMVVTGQKLTPTQRQDFQRLADALYSESVNQYNSKRKEYEGIATRNELPVADVLGSEEQPPAVRRYNPKTGRIE